MQHASRKDFLKDRNKFETNEMEVDSIESHLNNDDVVKERAQNLLQSRRSLRTSSQPERIIKTHL